MMRVLITRPTGAAQAAADQLRAAGHDVLVCPLISFAKTQAQAPSLAATQGFVVTDADGARALADMVGVRTFPVFCDSAGTAAELASLGFQDARSANGDATAMARLIERSISPKLGGLIYACSTSAPINLSAMLGNMGFAVRMAALYEVQRAEHLPDNLTQALKDETLDVAVFFTADEARAFAQLVVRAQLEHRVNRVVAVVAAPVVAAPLSVLKFAKVVTASRSDAAAVCAMVTAALLPLPETQPEPEAAPEPLPEPTPEPTPEAIPEPAPEPEPAPVVATSEIVAEIIASAEPEPRHPLEVDEPPEAKPARPSWRERIGVWFAKPATPPTEPAAEVIAEIPVVVEAPPQESESASVVQIELAPEPQSQTEPVVSEIAAETVAAPVSEQPATIQTDEPLTEPARPSWRERWGGLFAKPTTANELSVEAAPEAPAAVAKAQPQEAEPIPEPIGVAAPQEVVVSPPVEDAVVEREPEPPRPSWLTALRDRFAKPATQNEATATQSGEEPATAAAEERVVEPQPIAPPTPEFASPAVESIGPSVARALLERTSAWVRQRAEARKTEGGSALPAPEPTPVSEPLPEPAMVEAPPVAPIAKIETPRTPEPAPSIEAETVLAETLPAEPKPVSDESFAEARAGWLDWAKNYLATKANTPAAAPTKIEAVDEPSDVEPEQHTPDPRPEPVAVIELAPTPASSIDPVAEQEQVITSLSDLRPVANTPPARAGWLSRLWTRPSTNNETAPALIAPEAPMPTSEPERIESTLAPEPQPIEKTALKESPVATISPAPEIPAPVLVPDPPPEPPAAIEPLIVVPPPVKTPETPIKTIAAEMSEPETPSSNDPDALRVQRSGGRAARLLAEDAADARALNQRFKVAGSDSSEDDADQTAAANAPMPPPQRRGLPGIVYVMLLLIVAGGAAYIYAPDLLKPAPSPAAPTATAPQATQTPTPAPEAPTTASSTPDLTPAAATPTAEASGLAARIAVLEQRATPTPTEVTALEQRLAALEAAAKASSPAELSDSVTNQARQLTTVTARVATLEAAIGNVAKLEDMASRLNALEGKSAAATSVLALSERVTSLEKRDAVAATALVVASAQLREVARAGRPYGVELETVKQLAQRAGVVFNADALSGMAQSGLPTREQLQSTFAPMAAAATRAGLLPSDTADWFQRLSDRVLSIISIRPFGNTEGDSAGAILARAEQALRAGNISLALNEMNALTGGAATVAASWLANARAIVAAEQSLEELATRSVGAMGATTATTPAPAPAP